MSAFFFFLGRSPGLVQQLLLLRDETLVAHVQVLHDDLGVLLVRLPDGALVGLKLDDVYDFVWRN